jgi:hypothetical protein
MPIRGMKRPEFIAALGGAVANGAGACEGGHPLFIDAVVTLEAIRLFDQAAGTPAALFVAASRRHASLRSGCSSRA